LGISDVAFRKRWERTRRKLQEAVVGHGDLASSNIVVAPNSDSAKLVLVNACSACASEPDVQVVKKLRESFLREGARNVVVSEAAIDPQAASRLLASLYEVLSNESLPFRPLRELLQDAEKRVSGDRAYRLRSLP